MLYLRLTIRTPSVDYRLDIYSINPQSGNIDKIDEVRNFNDIAFYSVENGAGLMQAQLNGMSGKATGSNLRRYRNMIALYENSTPIWFGYIDTIRPSYRGDDYLINLECREYFSHLTARYTPSVLRFNQVDAGSIAWQLIDYTQGLTNGRLGINQGTIESTVLRDREYQYKNIGDAIIDLTEVIDGFDFDLTPVLNAERDIISINFNVYAEKGQIRSNVPPLNLGGNVLSFSAMNREEITNTVVYKGAGTGQDFITATQENTTSQFSYLRRENVVARDDISIQETLQQHADRYIDDFSIDYLTIDAEIRPESNLPYGSFNIGDSINVNFAIPEMTIKYTGLAKVQGIECQIDNVGVLRYTTRLQLPMP